MLFDMSMQVQSAQLAFRYDDLAAHNGPIGFERGAEDQRSERVLPGASVFQRVEVDSKEICTFAHLQRADILPAKNCSTTSGCEGQSLTRGHKGWGIRCRAAGAVYAAIEP